MRRVRVSHKNNVPGYIYLPLVLTCSWAAACTLPTVLVAMHW